MRRLSWIFASIGLACTPPHEVRPEPGPLPAAQPLPPASAPQASAPQEALSAPPPPPLVPFAVTAEQAKARIEALPEVKALAETSTYTEKGERKIQLVVWISTAAAPTCVEGACKHEIEAGDEEDPRTQAGRLSFVIDANTGVIEIRNRDDEGHDLGLAPYEAWSALQQRRESYIQLLFLLPEIQAYDAMLKRASGGKVRMTVRIEETPTLGCKAEAEDCAWQYYVGERHDDHTVRGHTYRIDDVSGKIWHISLDGERRTVRPPRTKPEPKPSNKK